MVTVIKDSLPISYYNSANLATNIESFSQLGGLIQIVNHVNEEEKRRLSLSYDFFILRDGHLI